MTTNKVLCPQTGTRDFIGPLAFWADGSSFALCLGCQRVVKAPNKPDGVLRQHSVRGKNTKSMDRTYESLWAYALERARDVAPFSPSKDYGIRCVHGVMVWFGHECGDCMDEGEFRTRAPFAKVDEPWLLPEDQLVVAKEAVDV